MRSTPPLPGLCDHCRHARRITSGRGSEFLLCELSRTDARFPRYPTLPVLACAGFEPGVGPRPVGDLPGGRPVEGQGF